MESSGAGAPERYKKKVKPRAVVLDPVESAIVVNIDTYILDTTQVGDDGQPLVVQHKPGQKRIVLRTFHANSSIPRFAAEVVNKCKYIHPSKVPHVEGLLTELQNRLRGVAGNQPIQQQQQQQPQPGQQYQQQQQPAQQQYQQQQFQQQQPQYSQQQTQQLQQQQHQYQEQQQYQQQPQYQQQQQIQQHHQYQQQQQQQIQQQQHQRSLQEQPPWQPPTIQTQQRPQDSPPQDVSRMQEELRQAQRRQEIEDEMEEKRRAEMQRQQPSQPLQGPAISVTGPTSFQNSNGAEFQNEHPVQQAGNQLQTPQFSFPGDLSAVPHGGHKNKGPNGDRPVTPRSPRSPLLVFPNEEDGSSGPAADSTDDMRSSVDDLRWDAMAGRRGSRRKDRPKKKKPLKASIKKLESYIEKLYEEDSDEKLKGTQLLLQLIQRDRAHVKTFVEHNTLIGALCRVLNEDRRKNMELTSTILEIFFCFSCVRQLHYILLRNKIGDTTMRIIDQETKRYEMRVSKGENKRDPAAWAKYLQKQEKLLYICFYILINLAEDPKIEYKMTSRDINKALLKMLHRDNADNTYLDELLLLIVTFLMKLSVVEENKDEMAQHDVLRRLLPLFKRRDQDLHVAMMRLLFNLSFDSDLRNQIVKDNLVSYFCQALRNDAAQDIALKILYNLSTDEKNSERFLAAIKPTVPFLGELIRTWEDNMVDETLMGFCINLAQHASMCELLCRDNNLTAMIKRVHQMFDPLLMKLISTISIHDRHDEWCARPLFAKHMHEMVGIITKSETPHFLQEALYCFANIVIPDHPYSGLLKHHKFLEYLLSQCLAPNFTNDGVILGAVMVIGTLATDPASSVMLAEFAVVQRLYSILVAKHEDEEIALQTVYTVYKLLLHDASRRQIIQHKHLPRLLLDLVTDPCEEIRDFAHMCLDIVMDYDEDPHQDLLRLRFEAVNREWIDAIKKGIRIPHRGIVGAGGNAELSPDLYHDERYGSFADEDHDEDISHTQFRDYDTGNHSDMHVHDDDYDHSEVDDMHRQHLVKSYSGHHDEYSGDMPLSPPDDHGWDDRPMHADRFASHGHASGSDDDYE